MKSKNEIVKALANSIRVVNTVSEGDCSLKNDCVDWATYKILLQQYLMYSDLRDYYYNIN